METLLKTGINHENAYEDNELHHPLEDLSFEEIERHMLDLRLQYPNYDDYRYDRITKAHGYGAETAWYDLVGIKV